MSLTDLRDTLASVSDAVHVPPLDRLAVERRVSSVRRRRRAVRVMAAAAAVTAMGAGAALLPGDDTPPPVVAPAEPANVVPVVLDGELAFVGADGTETRTGMRVHEVLGRGDNGVVTLDPDRHLVVASVTDAGDIGVIRDLSGGPVLGAAVSVDGTGLAWVGQDRILHLRGALDGSWSYDAAESGAFTGDLLATDGTNWVEGNDGSVALVTPQAAAAPVVLDVGAAVVAAQVAGDTVALRTDFETRFFDIATGRKRQVTASGRTGGLSPDGTLYVDDSLNVFNVHEGTSTGVGIGQDEVAVWWTSNASFAMVSQNGDHRVLWSCTIQPHRCIELYDDSTGTLELPGQE